MNPTCQFWRECRAEVDETHFQEICCSTDRKQFEECEHYNSNLKKRPVEWMKEYTPNRRWFG